MTLPNNKHGCVQETLLWDTVDGSEILHLPVEGKGKVVEIPLFTRF